MTETSTEGTGRPGGLGSVVDKVAGVVTEVGITGVRAMGMTVGYTNKMMRFFTKKGAGFSKPAGKCVFTGKGIFTGGVLKKWGGEKSAVKVDIAKTRRKMEAIYLEIGKLGAKLTEDGNIAEDGSIKDLIAEIKACESQIHKWESRLADIDDEKTKSRQYKASVKVDGRTSAIKDRIKDKIRETGASVTAATFTNSSDKSIFDKVVNDLLDDDVEIRLLATAELGKMGNAVSVPILKEAIGYGDVYLTSEIVNALINIDDPSCLDIFKANVIDKNYRVRLGCFRGIYKVGGAGSISFLIDGLKDKHPVVRKSVATFLGWIGQDDAAPSLIQTLKDSDQDVRKSAAMALSLLRDSASIMPLIRILGESDIEVREKIVSAIERISGKTVEFKLDSSGDELRENIEGLKDWWQKNRMSDVDGAIEVIDDSSDVAVADDETYATDEVEDSSSSDETVTAVDEIMDINSSESAESDEKSPEVENNVDDESDEGKSADSAETVLEGELGQFDKSKLFKMNKVKLHAKCDELGIAYIEDDTKAVLIEKINEKCGN